MASPGPGSGGNVAAAFASLVVPGLGQLLQGRALAFALWLVAAAVGWGLTVLADTCMVGIGVHVACAIEAARWAPRVS